VDIEELKKFLRVDGNDLDVVILGYQAAAEVYLSNAGVEKDYTNALYKVVVSMVAGTFLENPSLVVMGKGSSESLSITISALIAQLRLSQVTI